MPDRMQDRAYPRFLPAGDTALNIEFGARIDRAINDRVLALDHALRSAPPPGFVETLPTFRALLIHYDPLATSGDALEAHVRALLSHAPAKASTRRMWRIPACYEAAYAPDIDEIAARAGGVTADVVRLHTQQAFHVYMLGFVPGFAYMGDLPAALAFPRRQDPRVRVPAGSVAIATTMTAVYPVVSPGGWHLIGATPVRLFDARRQSPALFAPGDAVLFEPTSAAEYERIAAAVAAGDYTPPQAEVAA